MSRRKHVRVTKYSRTHGPKYKKGDTVFWSGELHTIVGAPRLVDSRHGKVLAYKIEDNFGNTHNVQEYELS